MDARFHIFIELFERTTAARLLFLIRTLPLKGHSLVPVRVNLRVLCDYLFSAISFRDRHSLGLEYGVIVCCAAAGEPRVDPVECERLGHRVPRVRGRRRSRGHLRVDAQLDCALALLAERGARLRRRTQLQRRRLGAHRREPRARRRR